MYDSNPAAEAGFREVQRLLKEKSGYPRRGALADLERATGSRLSGPAFGRIIRGETRPTERKTIEAVALALGVTYEQLRDVLDPPGTSPPLAPEPHVLARVSDMLNEALRMLNAAGIQPIEARRKPTRKKGLALEPSMLSY